MQQLRDLFCHRFGVSPAHYEKRALRVLLFPHAKLIVPLMRTFLPKYAEEDVKFVRYLGDAEDFQEAEAIVSEFRAANRFTRSICRNRFKLRVSGRKAGKLVRDLWSSAGRA